MDAADGLLALASTVAREAGMLLQEHFRAGGLVSDAKSTPTDPVTEADRAAERLIRDRLLAARPEDAILGEEGGDVAGTSRVRWIVDPLDGTVNFLFGIPQWGVSIAAEVDGETVAGVVYDPMRDELWTAAADARCNGELVTPSGRVDLATALVATGFGYDAGVRRVQAAVLARLLPEVRDVRRFGSAALDLAWTAAGRWDAYFERGVQPWDIAAGALLCRRAGLEVRALAPAPPAASGVLVAQPALADALAPLVR
jgi:myo-inositol-1(or 4)-monophosphatase